MAHLLGHIERGNSLLRYPVGPSILPVRVCVALVSYCDSESDHHIRHP